MSSQLDNFFNFFKDCFNESDKTNMIHMFNNLNTYNYDEIFTTDPSFNTLNIISKYSQLSLLSLNNNILHKGTIVSNDNKNIFKVYIFNNDQNKDLFIINCIREVYYSNTLRNALIDNNVEQIFIPEINQYGITGLSSTDQIIFFFKMPYYEHTNVIIPGEFSNLDIKTKFNILFDYLTLYTQSVSNVNLVENNIQIFHNDFNQEMYRIKYLNNINEILKDITTLINNNDIEQMDLYIQEQEQKHNCYPFNFLRINRNNIFNHNGKLCLIDFENAYSKPNKIKFLRHIICNLIEPIDKDLTIYNKQLNDGQNIDRKNNFCAEFLH
jgi:hypothetical protein